MTKQEHLETATICILINTDRIEDMDNNNNNNDHHRQHVIKIIINQSMMETKIKLDKVLIADNSYNNRILNTISQIIRK